MAPGGDIVSAFQQDYQLPPQVRWTNRESLTTFGRDADVLLLWNPQGYSANDMMQVLLTTTGLPTGSYSGLALQSISCSVAAQSGEITLPASLLQQMASGPGTLELFVAPQLRTVFKIPLMNGGTAPAVMTYFFSDLLAVAVQ